MMESPQKKRRLIQCEAIRPNPASAAVLDPTPSQTNATHLDVLLQAMENREKETAACMIKTDPTNDFGIGIVNFKSEGHYTTYGIPETAAVAEMQMPSTTSGVAVTVNSSCKILEDDQNANFELSQSSFGETMLKNYEPLMHEVLGSQSKLSQELKDEFHPEMPSEPTILAMVPCQPYSDVKPPFLFSQSNPLQQSQPVHVQQPSQTQSQQFPTTQQSQQFSMTVSSLPSLGMSQQNSLPNTSAIHQAARTSFLPEKSITKNSILRTKTTKMATEETATAAKPLPRKTIKEQCAEESSMKDMAKRAADLINTLAESKKVEKQLLLSMTLTRQSPRSAGSVTIPPPGTKLTQGFQWAQFPPLEKFLRKYMEEYYELSIEKCQSVLQQEFNNKLVKKVIEMATFYGWSFDFTHKGIRDRVRCYFKTHIQNAKKRLKTMCKNPTKKANAKALCAHLDLIEMHKETHEELEFANEFMKDRGSTFNTTPGVFADDDDEDAAKVLAEGFNKKIYS